MSKTASSRDARLFFRFASFFIFISFSTLRLQGFFINVQVAAYSCLRHAPAFRPSHLAQVNATLPANVQKALQTNKLTGNDLSLVLIPLDGPGNPPTTTPTYR